MSDSGIHLSTIRIGVDVADERIRAHRKHGQHSMEGWQADHPSRLPILVEEVGEVARELNERALGNVRAAASRERLRAELVQVAAMAVAWIAALDERNKR